jgi:Mrp family chromosome partitioning ATPase
MQDLLRTLDRYKMIVVDLPAYEHGADGLLVCPLLDGVMVVAESGSTPLDSLADLARTLRIANAPILGVLLAHRRRLARLRVRRRSSGRPAPRLA